MKLKLLVEKALLNFTAELSFELVNKEKEKVYGGTFTLAQDVKGIVLMPNFRWKNEEPRDLQEKDFLLTALCLGEFAHSIYDSLNLSRFVSRNFERSMRFDSLVDLLQKFKEESRKLAGRSYDFSTYQRNLRLNDESYELRASTENARLSTILIVPFVVDGKYASTFVSEVEVHLSPNGKLEPRSKVSVASRYDLPYDEDLIVKKVQQEVKNEIKKLKKQKEAIYGTRC